MVHAADSFLSFRLPLRVSRLLAGVIAVTTAALIGCAAPAPHFSNVVRDTDVVGCSSDDLASVRGLDVAIVIDTSQSTRRPSGYDVDRDGAVRAFRRNATFDKGDSRLAAQIAAVRPLIRAADGQDIRFSIVTFSGASIARTIGRTKLSGSKRDSRLRARLGTSTAQLESVLDEILAQGSNGLTIFYGGMRRASLSLLAEPTNGRRRLVLFMSDSANSWGRDVDDAVERLDSRMKNAALVARDHGIVFHTFGLSEHSADWRGRSIGQIAGATGGSYHPVEDPRNFYCHLARTLAPAAAPRSDWQRAFATHGRGELEGLPLAAESAGPPR